MTCLSSPLQLTINKMIIKPCKSKVKQQCLAVSINLALHRYGKLTCHMGSHTITCHPTEVRIPPLLPAEARTRFRDPGGMQG